MFMFITDSACSVGNELETTLRHPTTVNKDDCSGINCKDQAENFVGCVTKLGKAIEFVMAKTNEVMQFDKARQKYKQFPADKLYYDAFMRKVAVMETSVSKQQRETRVKLSQWERDFFINNNCKVATEKDIAACSHAQLLRNKLKYAKAILSKLRS
jgi:galactokinase